MILIIAAIIVGLLAWSGNPVLLPLAMFFPALWAMTPTRACAGLVSCAYFLAASHGLPRGVINFYGSGQAAGLMFWLAASAGFVVVHVMFWTSQTGWKRALRYAAIAIVMAVPPIGIVGWAHPVTAAGMVFPGWGWSGLAAQAIGLLIMTTRMWPIATLALGGWCLWSAATWTPPDMPRAWQGVNTNLGRESGRNAAYVRHLETVALVGDLASNGIRVLVLPEGAMGIWTPSLGRRWEQAIAKFGVTVLAGAIVLDEAGYDNVLIEISGSRWQVLYRQRMPVPVSMWRPWLALLRETGGARAWFFDNPIIVSNGLTIAPLICYEQLIIWPILQSALHSPDVIVAIGNGWWTQGTNIIPIQRATTIAWARLFDLPLIMAVNT